MEILWNIFIIAWICCLIGWLLTVIVPTWRKNWDSLWWIIGIQVLDLGVLITSLFL